jgi:hypothetical protein
MWTIIFESGAMVKNIIAVSEAKAVKIAMEFWGELDDCPKTAIYRG